MKLDPNLREQLELLAARRPVGNIQDVWIQMCLQKAWEDGESTESFIVTMAQNIMIACDYDEARITQAMAGVTRDKRLCRALGVGEAA